MTIPQFTLPFDAADMLKLDAQVARAAGQSLQDAYLSAQPFPHTVLDRFLPDELAEKVWRNFPLQPVRGDQHFEFGFVGHHKRQVQPAECSGFNRELFNFFNSAPVLKFLEGVSGIKGLLPDPYFMGGGFHEIAKGGMLGIHADFRLNKPLNLARRLNMLIYLNKDWNEEWGGQLELWDRQKTGKVVEVFPHHNRCVIFNTDADTFHGHPDPLNCPSSVTRRSIALYYYTASPAVLTEVPDDPTVYVQRPNAVEAAAATRSISLMVDKAMGQLMPPILMNRIYKSRARRRAVAHAKALDKA